MSAERGNSGEIRVLDIPAIRRPLHRGESRRLGDRSLREVNLHYPLAVVAGLFIADRVLVGVVTPLHDDEALLQLGALELITRRPFGRAPRYGQLLEVLRFRCLYVPFYGGSRSRSAWKVPGGGGGRRRR